MLWPSLAGRDWAPTSWQGMARMNCFFCKNDQTAESLHFRFNPSTNLGKEFKALNIRRLFHVALCTSSAHVPTEDPLWIPNTKNTPSAGIWTGPENPYFFKGFYGIITGKLWVFTGSGKTWFWEILWVLWEDYGFFMGKLWVFTQNPLFPAIIRQKTHKFRFQIPWL